MDKEEFDRAWLHDVEQEIARRYRRIQEEIETLRKQIQPLEQAKQKWQLLEMRYARVLSSLADLGSND